MSRPIRYGVLVPLALTALMLLALAAPARAAESFQSCSGTILSLPAVISTQGTWCMKSDLSTSMATGRAITVEAGNVTIDCNGYKLSGLAAGRATQTLGVYATDRVSVTVRNCNIRGFLDGVHLTGGGSSAYEVGGSHLVEDSRFEANRRTGIMVVGVGSVIRRNIVVDTGESTAPGVTRATAIHMYQGGDIVDNYVWGVMSDEDEVATVGIDYVSNGISTSIVRNSVHLPMNGSADSAYGIRRQGTGGVAIVGNQVHVHGYAQTTVGIQCQYTVGQVAKDNVVTGMLTKLETCTDGGGNAW